MKKRIKKLIPMLLLAAALLAVGLHQYHRREGLRFVKTLGNGINLGNSLDAHGITKHKEKPSVEDFETYWQNPPISAALLRAVKDAGFSLVRIPVTWEEHMDEAGLVDPLWMDRVETVVRQALELDLFVILDTHHEAWLDLAENETKADARFSKLWEQIGLRFSDCGEKLLFEGLNEPRLRGGELEWTGGDDALRERVNRLNRLFVSTVRAAGGENAQRYLLLAPYCHSTDAAAMAALELPDQHCIAAVHIYTPYRFCQKEDGPADWDPEGTDAARLNAVLEEMERCFTRRSIPVIVTECGCIDKQNEAARILWVQGLRAGAARCASPIVWWDDGGEFRLLNRETGAAFFPELLR